MQTVTIEFDGKDIEIGEDSDLVKDCKEKDDAADQ